MRLMFALYHLMESGPSVSSKTNYSVTVPLIFHLLYVSVGIFTTPVILTSWVRASEIFVAVFNSLYPPPATRVYDALYQKAQKKNLQDESRWKRLSVKELMVSFLCHHTCFVATLLNILAP
ncbi:unnamed protein product, partial [Allacma fusca]